MSRHRDWSFLIYRWVGVSGDSLTLRRFPVPILLEAEIFPDMPEHDPGWRPFQAARFSIELAMLGQ